MQRIGGTLRGLVAAAVLSTWSAPAVAHAIVMRSVPAADAAVNRGMVGVELVFNSRVDMERSRATLLTPSGAIVAVAWTAGGMRGDAETTLHARVSADAAGDYALHWQVLALDGHITRGVLPFHVAGASRH